MTHDFRQSLAAGLDGEERVAAYLREHGRIVEDVTRDEQFAGRDCYVSNPETGGRASVEIKTDKSAHRTGNVVAELVSNAETGRPGWLHTCTADWLLYFIPGAGADVLYWLQPEALRAALPAWMAAHGRGEIRGYRAANRDRAGRLYHTTGLLLPQAEFERLAVHVSSL